MAGRTTVFVNKMSMTSWVMIGLALVIAGGFIAIEYGLTYAAAVSAGLALFIFIGMIVVIKFAARRQVAELVTDGTSFFIETFVLFGEGRRLVVPISEIEDWRWLASSGNMTRFATLGFVWKGEVYRIPFNGAQILDREILSCYAPGPLARANAPGR